MLIVPRVMERLNKNDVKEGTDIITVSGMKVQYGDMKATVELIGNILPEESVNVMVSVPAKVEEVMVFVGDYVEEGDLLFIMNGENIEDQIIQAELGVKMADIGVANANAGVEQANIAYNMAKSNYEIQLANYNFGKKNLANYEQLLAEGVVSQMEYDQVKLQAADETVNILEDQLAQAAARLSQSRLGVESSSTSLTQAKDGLATAGDMLEDMTVTAPISGFITTSNITENNFASNVQPTVVIQNINSIKISTNVTESLVNKIVVGDRVSVNIDATSNKSFTGTIETLGISADPRTLLFPMTIKIHNMDGSIKPGMFATVEIIKAESENTIYVPSEVVVLRDEINYLYLLKDENSVAIVPVKVGIDNGIYTEIISGVTDEDIVITKGIGLIDESSTIKVIRSDQ